MIYLFCKSLRFLALSLIFSCFVFFFEAFSQVQNENVRAGLQSSVGTATATVVANTLNIQNPNSLDDLFEIPEEYSGYFVKNNKAFNDWQIIYKIQSQPNTFLDISYRDKKLLNENYQIINGKRYLVLDLQNPNGEIIQARLKVDKNMMFFDDSGREDLALNPEIVLKNKNQDKGTYRALYYIVVSY